MAESNTNRIAECVSACAGIENHAEAIKAAREALECCIYAIQHPSSDQQFATNAAKQAIALLGKEAS